MKAPVYLVPFSHLDLFWAGSREECLTRGIEVIRTALRLLRKYPDYRFMIEAANFLEFFCESCPDEGPELKRYAAKCDLADRSAVQSCEAKMKRLLLTKGFLPVNLSKNASVSSLSLKSNATITSLAIFCTSDYFF